MAVATQTIDADALADLVAGIFTARGMAPADARLVAQVLVWADCGGHESHGVSRVERYLGFIAKGDLDPRARPCVTRSRAGIALVDGHRCAGALAMDAAVEAAYEGARACGVGWAAVSRTTHVGPAGYFAQALAARGCVAIVMAGGGPMMAYHGAASAALATAPLAIAAPVAGEPPLVLDMASSVAAIGKIREAARAGRSIPAGWALDAAGAPTTDPASADILLPFAGAKGSGLSLMIETLTGVLAGAPLIAPALAPGGKTRHSQNALVIAADIEAFRPRAAFEADAAALVAAIRALPRSDPAQAILTPGERSARLRAQRRAGGVPVKAKVMAALRQALVAQEA